MEKVNYRTSEVQQPPLPPSRASQSRQSIGRGLSFDKKKPTNLFCATTSFTSASFQGQWTNSLGIRDFVKSSAESPREQFNMIVGSGNGTLHPLSTEESVFEEIVSGYGFPRRIGEILGSIHGCICKVTDEINGHQWLTIIFSTPKGPVKELFCVMKISLSSLSTTCLVFDCEEKDLNGEGGLITSFRDTWCTNPAFRNPLGVLSLLIIQCGRVSEIKRRKGDDEVLNVEIRTESTPWNDPNVTVVRSPSDYLRTITFAHLCYNNLLFIENTVNFEIDIWGFTNELLQKGTLTEKMSPLDKKRLGEEIEYYKQWTRNRKSQLKCLQERNRVQINLITNLIAQEETSQSKIIGAVALLFAPASLVTSIFSAGLFVVNDKSWEAYLVSTLVTTFVVLLLGWSYVQGYLQRIHSATRNDPSHNKSSISSERRSSFDFV